jgi:hypothetical protein
MDDEKKEDPVVKLLKEILECQRESLMMKKIIATVIIFFLTAIIITLSRGLS